MRPNLSTFHPFPTSSLQDQISRLFSNPFDPSSEAASITTWADAGR